MAEGELLEFEGEMFEPTWITKWIETGKEIAAGTLIVPVALCESDKTIEHAALHLAADDLNLARQSFEEAAKLGLPNNENSLSKALIHAAIMAYARSFAGGVRGFRLNTEFFEAIWGSADIELHAYLYNLRDKHVAHSVNDFERATTVGVVVADQSWRLLGTNPSGVGVTKLSMVGLPMSKLKLCPAHIEVMMVRITDRIAELDQAIYAEFRAGLAVGELVKPAPLVTLPDRSKVAERRR
ncbi:hypothetical protein [Sphingomonas crocodyli]|uniref:Uncharacterized protein n=1 Tax=Sphingomonas crocodyli TaxID=1979270 RepID=A0A437M676_9SPHN|nr:hypothetical protein [Sphingomonas crocodyli]RVT93147.1 hypothetical protein EOD43_04440 [Sphingomonas crocodyli]